MKHRTRITLLVATLVALFTSVSGFAAVTLQFASGSAKLTNLANAAGTVTDGMIWGVVVDTTGDGFDSVGPGSYDGFAMPTAGAGTFLSAGGGLTDDFFFRDDNVSLTQAIGGTDGGSGAITTIDNVPFYSGKNFAILWMPVNSGDGSAYGFFSDPTFVTPAVDGSPQNYAAAFAGADPVRAASNTFGGALAPEPSRMMLALFGIGLVGLRRRR